jgi:predicted Zn-dependent protease
MIRRQISASCLILLTAMLIPLQTWAEGENDPMWQRRTIEKKMVTVGQRILNANHIQQVVGFHFTKIDTPNAYATSTFGNVVVQRGLIQYFESDDELAGILAHEIGHVIKKHSPKGLVRHTAGTVLMTSALYGADLLLFLGTPVISAMYLGHVARGGSGMGEVMSRSQEYEADQVGIDLMVKAGYNPYAFVSIMRKIGGDADYLWSSHPMTSKRLARVEAQILKKYPDIAPPLKMQDDASKTTPNLVEKTPSVRPTTEAVASMTQLETSDPTEASVTQALESIDPHEDPDIAIRQLTDVIARQQKELDALKQSSTAQSPIIIQPAASVAR